MEEDRLDDEQTRRKARKELRSEKELGLGVVDLQVQRSLLGEVEEGEREGIRFPGLARVEERHGCSVLTVDVVAAGVNAVSRA